MIARAAGDHDEIRGARKNVKESAGKAGMFTNLGVGIRKVSCCCCNVKHGRKRTSKHRANSLHMRPRSSGLRVCQEATVPAEASVLVISR